MKKILLATTILSIFAVISSDTAFGVPYGYLSPTSEGTSQLAPLMEYEFEKKETLDFKNNPEAYRQKREKKDKFLDYQEGKLDLPQNVRTQYYMQNSAPGTNNLKFIKGDDGQIKIQSF